ncbi:MAG: ribonuclease P protein component [Parcubacteria group bacterium]|nr:ribonuclease P protein component [Parcubacteria group bacterium]
MALPRKSRLSSSSEIKKILKDGLGLNLELFQVKFLPVSAGPSRFAIIVSSRVSKKASVRNRIKRKLSETIRLNISKFRSGFLIVIVAKPKLASKELSGSEQELVNNLIKIGRLK